MDVLLKGTIVLGLFAVTAYRDWKEKSIYLYIPIIAAIVSIILHLVYRNNSLVDMLSGAGIGAVMILIAWVSKESVGIGDGVMLMVSGLFLGFRANMELFITALLLAGVAALMLMVGMRKERSYRMPFIPFLLVAYVFQLI